MPHSGGVAATPMEAGQLVVFCNSSSSPDAHRSPSHPPSQPGGSVPSTAVVPTATTVRSALVMACPLCHRPFDGSARMTQPREKRARRSSADESVRRAADGGLAGLNRTYRAADSSAAHVVLEDDADDIASPPAGEDDASIDLEDVTVDPAVGPTSLYGWSTDYFSALPLPRLPAVPLLANARESGAGGEFDGRPDEESDSASTGEAPPSPPHSLPSYYSTHFVEGPLLGRGAFGSVHLCHHVVDGESVGLFAVKKIPVGTDPSYLKKILTEVKILSRVGSHPNVTQYFHAWLEEDVHLNDCFGPAVRCLFVLMEYASLGSLDTYVRNLTAGGSQPAGGADGDGSGPWVDEHRQLSNRLISMFFLQSLKGLSHLHKLNIVHRDIKPQNMLLTPMDAESEEILLGATNGAAATGDRRNRAAWDSYRDAGVRGMGAALGSNLSSSSSGGSFPATLLGIPRVLLSDFGTAALMRSEADAEMKRPRTGATGTEDYMAPELLEVTMEANSGCRYLHRHTTASDMYALGCVLHYLAYQGQLPILPADPSTEAILACDEEYGWKLKTSFAGTEPEDPVAASKAERRRRNAKQKPGRRLLIGYGQNTAASGEDDGPPVRPPQMIAVIRLLLRRSPSDRPSAASLLSLLSEPSWWAQATRASSAAPPSGNTSAPGLPGRLLEYSQPRRSMSIIATPRPASAKPESVQPPVSPSPSNVSWWSQPISVPPAMGLALVGSAVVLGFALGMIR